MPELRAKDELMLGRITYWNNFKGFGFCTVSTKEATGGTSQQQYFFHWSNFLNYKNGEHPTIGGIVRFDLGEPLAKGKKVQAINVRYATAEEVAAEASTRLGPGVAALLSGGATQ
jgi:cold shock CspA family protein